MYDSVAINCFSLNELNTFEPKQLVWALEAGDSMILNIVNNDTSNHQLKIDGMWTSSIIGSGNNIVDTLVFSDSGLFIIYDPLSQTTNDGLSGIVQVGFKQNMSFYWNIRTFDSNGASNSYTPNYFTVNTNSKPDIVSDSSAVPRGNIGDTINIFIANTGLSIHSLHFHGFHSEIIYSSKFAAHVGRIKDTFPVYPRSSLILRMIPDKLGIYPVHDHNLTAVSGGGYYPNGMFISMEID